MSWKEIKNKDTGAQELQKTFKFKDFVSAWAFMTRVAMIAEKMNHHPDWSNSYNEVRISLSTHSAGNSVTAKDRTLAEEIDAIDI
ncbi:MAG: 4a-hydroxytetrahydrobiopterin dehydratase [Daejeonella sp.]